MPPYQEISAAKCEERESKIPKEWRITLPEDDDNLMDLPRQCGILTEQEFAITEHHDSVSLLGDIASGKLSCLEVITAFNKVLALKA